MPELLYKNEVYRIVDAAVDVYTELQPGFPVEVYLDALSLEFAARGVPFRHPVELPVFYKGARLREHFTVDFLTFEKAIVQVKVLPALSTYEESQLLSAVCATQMEIGVLLNFGCPEKLEWRRRVSPLIKKSQTNRFNPPASPK